MSNNDKKNVTVQVFKSLKTKENSVGFFKIKGKNNEN